MNFFVSRPVWTTHTWGRLKGKPPLSVFTISPPPWSHDHRKGREAVITFAGCFFGGNNVGFIFACAFVRGLRVKKHCVPWEAADIWVTARRCWREPERWLIGLRFRFALVAHWWLQPRRRSLMWLGTASIRTDCGLITSVTCPVPYHVVLLLHGFLTQTTSPSLILSRYFPFGQQFGFYALNPDMVPVQCVGWCGGGWNVILWGDVVPVDHLRHRTILPSCDGLDNPVVPLDDPVSARHVGAPKPKMYAPVICKLPELLTGKRGAIVGQYLCRGATLKEETL